MASTRCPCVRCSSRISSTPRLRYSISVRRAVSISASFLTSFSASLALAVQPKMIPDKAAATPRRAVISVKSKGDHLPFLEWKSQALDPPVLAGPRLRFLVQRQYKKIHRKSA
ncbi:hypothetical protein DSY4921 [Desulfitobacterium hafniense Y51]|uniref:Uncharacterized protein n=1 Tax=Desulfitobacterium hafniense (strain Y51) TaxID=138119 RepID=Q24MN2_DESHY|nr:hypothetical protein DSY4921 [Desulfitobacterium hafniense Y51]